MGMIENKNLPENLKPFIADRFEKQRLAIMALLEDMIANGICERNPDGSLKLDVNGKAVVRPQWVSFVKAQDRMVSFCKRNNLIPPVTEFPVLTLIEHNFLRKDEVNQPPQEACEDRPC
jgi:hypothetical protein